MSWTGSAKGRRTLSRGRRQHGDRRRLHCGCDGFYGVGARRIPQEVIRIDEWVYPSGGSAFWRRTRPVNDELMIATMSVVSARTMRSMTRSRYDLQVCRRGRCRLVRPALLDPAQAPDPPTPRRCCRLVPPLRRAWCCCVVRGRADAPRPPVLAGDVLISCHRRRRGPNLAAADVRFSPRRSCLITGVAAPTCWTAIRHVASNACGRRSVCGG